MDPQQRLPPLTGIRVLDLSQVFSGPYATRILGDLGAEVIKIESTGRLDPERGPTGPKAGSGTYPGGDPGTQPYNRAARFVEYNRNKFGLTLDLVTNEGRDLFRRLVRISDVVVENFSVGVMGRLGFACQDLRALKPDLIVLSMPAFGATGPEKKYVAMGPQQECLSGLASMTGYDAEHPLSCWIFYPDQTVALFAASAILSALLHRAETGEGSFIELAQREAMIFALPETVLERTITGERLSPMNNRHPVHSPHGCYRTRGEDSWLAIAVTSDDEWRALSRCLGRPDLADDPRFRNEPERKRHESEIDALIQSWVISQDNREAMVALQAAGVPAGTVLDTEQLLSDPHFAAREFFQSIEYSAGLGTLPSLGFPWRFSATPATIRMPAPRLGEHSRLLLHTLLGVSADELSRLEERGVIGTVPRAREG